MARTQAWAIMLALACATAAATPAQAQAQTAPTPPERPQRPERPPDPQATAQHARAEQLAKLGHDANDAQRYDEALRHYDEALRLDPENLGALMFRGWSLVRLDRCEEAVTAIDAFEARDFILAESLLGINAFNDRAFCLFKLGDYAKAAENLEQQLYYMPDDDWAWGELGRAYTLLNRHEDSERAYKRAIELKPNDPYPHYGLALEYIGTSRLNEARASLQQALALDPNHTDAKAMLARVEQELVPKPAPATQPAPAAAARPATPAAPAATGPRAYPPIDARSPLGRGIALYRQTELQQSLPHLIEATRLDPQDARGFAYLCAAYYMLSVHSESEAACERARALDLGILATVR